MLLKLAGDALKIQLFEISDSLFDELKSNKELRKEFKTDVSGFITAMGKEVVSEYEFVQAGEHKSHLLMSVLDMKALEAEMTSDAAKEWDKKNNCKDTIYAIEIV